MTCLRWLFMTFQPCAVHYLFSFFHTSHWTPFPALSVSHSIANVEASLPRYPLSSCSVCVTHGIQGGYLQLEVLNTGPLQHRWTPQLLKYGAFRVPSQGRNQSSLLCCASQATLTVSLPLVCFYLILKMRICSVCCCVNIKYIFIVFQTYVHIYKCYIYIMSTHGHMYSRYFKELFIKKSKCYK